jgi:hypothetical protein
MPGSTRIALAAVVLLFVAAVAVIFARKDPFEVFCQRVAASRTADVAGWRHAVALIADDMTPRDTTRATLKMLEYRSYVPFLAGIRSLGAVAPDKHSEVLEHAARDAGMTGWSCPAFADHARALAADLAQGQAAAEKVAAPKPPPEEVAKPAVPAPAEDQPGCDPVVISGYVRRNLRAIQACYSRELHRDPTLKGKVVVGFTIGTTGRVKDVEVEENTLEGKEVGLCIRNAIRMWVFPMKDVECPVRYPFVFNSAP